MVMGRRQDSLPETITDKQVIEAFGVRSLYIIKMNVQVTSYYKRSTLQGRIFEKGCKLIHKVGKRMLVPRGSVDNNKVHTSTGRSYGSSHCFERLIVRRRFDIDIQFISSK